MSLFGSAQSPFDAIMDAASNQVGADGPETSSGRLQPPGAFGQWTVAALLVTYWVGWGGMFALWLFSSGSESLHGLLLIIMAAIGILVAVLALTSVHMIEELRRSKAAQTSAAAEHARPRAPQNGEPILHSPSQSGRALASPPPLPPHVVAEGELMGRYYRHYSDGSVEIATLLGVRRFETLTDARQFIGPDQPAAVH